MQNRHRTLVTLVAVWAGAALSAHPAQSQVVSYTASDAGAGPGGTFTNSNAEAQMFDAAARALAPASLVTFESAPVGSFTSLGIAPGVTVTGIAASGNPLSILNAPANPPNTAISGFNTTPGGSNYLFIRGGTATFTFATPIQAFGAYFSGVQPSFFRDTLTFSDGTSQSVNVASADGSSGGVSFTGFTDAGKSISAVTLTASGSTGDDYIGLDDLRFASGTSPVPEASTTVSFGLLLALGLGGVMIAKRKKAAIA